MQLRAILEAKGGAVYTISMRDRLDRAAAKLRDHRVGALVVSDDEAGIEGILSERDIVQALALHGPEALARAVADFMTKDVITGRLEQTADEIMAVMTERRIRHLPVLADGEMVGIVSIGDIVKVRLGELADEADQLRNYILQG